MERDFLSGIRVPVLCSVIFSFPLYLLDTAICNFQVSKWCFWLNDAAASTEAAVRGVVRTDETTDSGSSWTIKYSWINISSSWWCIREFSCEYEYVGSAHCYFYHSHHTYSSYLLLLHYFRRQSLLRP